MVPHKFVQPVKAALAARPVDKVEAQADWVASAARQEDNVGARVVKAALEARPAVAGIASAELAEPEARAANPQRSKRSPCFVMRSPKSSSTPMN